MGDMPKTAADPSTGRSCLPTHVVDGRREVDGDAVRGLIGEGWRLFLQSDAAEWSCSVDDVEGQPASGDSLDDCARTHLLDDGSTSANEAKTGRYVLRRNGVQWSPSAGLRERIIAHLRDFPDGQPMPAVLKALDDGGFSLHDFRAAFQALVLEHVIENAGAIETDPPVTLWRLAPAPPSPTSPSTDLPLGAWEDRSVTDERERWWLRAGGTPLDLAAEVTNNGWKVWRCDLSLEPYDRGDETGQEGQDCADAALRRMMAKGSPAEKPVIAPEEPVSAMDIATTDAENDTERMAAIGRAVVEHLMPANPRAMREAAPEGVVSMLRRQRDELHSLQTSSALRIGRAVIDVAGELRQLESRRG